ncbi:MAG: DUF1292 domain-containing protein [Clostridia bacterium]|nr:DUF1292 domain-containing protein [Clostridia bacterium]
MADKKKKNGDPIRDVDEIIELSDEAGNVIAFELLDIVDYEGTEYAILFPCDDPESEEVVITVLTDDPDNPEQELYLPVEDEALLNRVFDYFKQVDAEYYNFK